MSVSVLEAPAPIICTIKFKRSAPEGEPPLDEMAEMIELIDAVVDQIDPSTLQLETVRPSDEGAYELGMKIAIMQEAVRRAEERDDRRKALYALYVFALFRFRLTSKHLTWLVPRLGETAGQLRPLNNKASRLRDTRYQGA